jgi:site-specific recombinase XerD
MTTFESDYNYSQDPIIQDQIKSAMKQYAEGINAETPVPSDHTLRLTFATNVLNGNVNWQEIIETICAFGSVNASTTDAQMSNYCAACWSSLAGG